MIKGVLFDLDGTLVPAPDWHRRAFDLALADFGHEPVSDHQHALLNGLGTKEKITMLFGPKYPRADEINARKQKYTHELIEEKCRPVEHIKEAVEHAFWLTSSKIAVVTNCLRPTTLRMLELSGLRNLFSVIVTASDVRKKKPSPIPFRQAAAHLGLIPHVCLAVDDSRHGIESAYAARCNVWELASMEELTAKNLEVKFNGILQ